MTEKQTLQEDDLFQHEAARRARIHLNRKGKAVMGAAGVLLAGGAAYLGNELIDAGVNYNATHIQEETVYNPQDLVDMLEPSITQLQLGTEVRLRTDGMLVHADNGDLMPSANLIFDYKSSDKSDKSDKATVVQTPNGVYVRKDENGTWYGFSSSLLPANFHEQKLQQRLDLDKDGIVWVNSRDASPVVSVVGDVATPTDNPSDPTNLAGLNH